MERRKRPRVLTLSLPDIMQPYLVLNGSKYHLQNFSNEGIGVYIPSPPPYGLNKGNKISGDIEIGNEIFPVKLEVIRHTKGVFGLKIIHQTQELKKLFNKLLEPAYYASELKLHANEMQNGVYKLWYTGPSNTELLLLFDINGNLKTLQLCWLGKWVFRNEEQLKTGILKTFVAKGSIIKDDELLVRHNKFDKLIVEEALKFFSYITKPLSDHLVEFLQSGISTTYINLGYVA